LELALRLAIAEGATEIDDLAVLGGRLDQSLANLLLLTRPEWEPVRVRAIAGNEMAWPVRSGQKVIIKGTPGDVLSLIPLTPTVSGVHLSGVKWPLQAATLHFGSTGTVSNALVEGEAQLQVGEGLVLVVQQSGA
jgi:thiamine pyrophosphokinase